mmetsp:Transcript_80083/g.235554  ORF Transcript_80083/g.235554 Transcript_80083/m.235554 type:complete len:120 (+) Transcript_80083:1092-1451(+)
MSELALDGRTSKTTSRCWRPTFDKSEPMCKKTRHARTSKTKSCRGFPWMDSCLPCRLTCPCGVLLQYVFYHANVLWSLCPRHSPFSGQFRLQLTEEHSFEAQSLGHHSQHVVLSDWSTN